MTDISIWPKTINEAVELMIDTISEVDKMELVNTKPDGLYRFQYSLGMLICGWFGLYNGNKALLAACANTRKNVLERLLVLNDPEEASVILIEAIRKQLRADMEVPV
ncbi:MAG: hypothetical protein HKK66_13510 [Chlorobiaceae bacterium]|nr:hypothetical protein [Chlorobiaceae bacterium]